MEVICSLNLSIPSESIAFSRIMTQSKLISFFRNTLIFPKLRSSTVSIKLYFSSKRFTNDSELPMKSAQYYTNRKNPLHKIMNFLNKRYTSGQSSYLAQSTKGFPQGGSPRKEPSLLNGNNCEIHPLQTIRHTCLECLEMLCSECITEHLEFHREANNIPRIQSIKQTRMDMSQKLEDLSKFMAVNTSQRIELEQLRKHSFDKIELMRRELLHCVDQWINNFKQSLMSSIGFEEVSQVKHQMEKLEEEIGLLKNSVQTSGSAQVLKKVSQIDGGRLQKSFIAMDKKYIELQKRSEFSIQLNKEDIIRSLTHCIVVKGSQPLERDISQTVSEHKDEKAGSMHFQVEDEVQISQEPNQ